MYGDNAKGPLDEHASDNFVDRGATKHPMKNDNGDDGDVAGDNNQQHLLPVFPNIGAFLSRTNAIPSSLAVIYHCPWRAGNSHFIARQ